MLKSIVKSHACRIALAIVCATVLCAAFSACSGARYFVTLVDGDEIMTTILTDTSGRAEVPSPEKDGYVFDGWYLDAQLQDKFESGDVLRADTTLYCGWTSNRYTVTFDAAGGNISGQTSMVIASGDIVELPVPTKDGYRFVCWTCDGEDVVPTAAFERASDVTYTAKWAPNVYTLTYHPDGGIVIGDGEKFVGDVVTQPAVYGEPLTPFTAGKNGYTFAGWRIDGTSEMLAGYYESWSGSDIEVTAVWR